MSQPLLLNRIFQRADDVILAQHIVENLGSIFSGKNLVTHVDTLVFCPPNSMPFVRLPIFLVGGVLGLGGVEWTGRSRTFSGSTHFWPADKD